MLIIPNQLKAGAQRRSFLSPCEDYYFKGGHYVIKKTNNQSTSLIHQAFGKPVDRSSIIAEIESKPDVDMLFKAFTPGDQERIIQFLTGECTLQILYDKFFQKVMNPTDYPERVESLISAIFGQKVKIVAVSPREGSMISDEGSQVIMDILVILEDSSYVNIEMQRLGYLFPGERSSCYLADMLMRQYGKVRHEKGEDFSYKDMKPVSLIVIMEHSLKEFKAVAPEYIHRRITTYSSHADISNLENIIYISLDTFKNKEHNEIENNLDAWLTFFTAEKPADVIRLLKKYPDFLPLYQDIAEFRKNLEEVIGMFSEALRIMDRNTTKYMFDDLHKQVEELSKELADMENKNSSLERQNSSLIQQNADKDAALADKDRTIEMLESQMKKLSGQ